VNMPRMDGFEFCKRLKEDPLYRFCHDIPILMLTVRTSDETRDKAFEYGVDLFLRKTEIREPKSLTRPVLNLSQKSRISKKTLADFRRIVTHSQAMIFMIDTEGIFQLFEGKTLNVIGLSPGEVVGKSIKEIFKDDQGLLNAIDDSLAGNTSDIVSEKDGHAFETFVFPNTDSGNEVAGTTIMAVDITERLRKEKQIQASLKEKQTLIDEIHHRVKNNMAVMASLLKMQINTEENQRVKDALKEILGRVYSMSAIHENLHHSEQLSAIDLKDYLSKLSSMLLQTYSIDTEKIALDIEAPHLKIDIEQANPLGLVLNELISNSLKYAFPGDKKGTISIKLDQKNGQNAELIIKDDGVGMPKDFDWKTADSLGLKLVRTLVEHQLDGSIDMESENGTQFTIKFDIYKTNT